VTWPRCAPSFITIWKLGGKPAAKQQETIRNQVISGDPGEIQISDPKPVEDSAEIGLVPGIKASTK